MTSTNKSDIFSTSGRRCCIYVDTRYRHDVDMMSNKYDIFATLFGCRNTTSSRLWNHVDNRHRRRSSVRTSTLYKHWNRTRRRNNVIIRRRHNVEKLRPSKFHTRRLFDVVSMS